MLRPNLTRWHAVTDASPPRAALLVSHTCHATAHLAPPAMSLAVVLDFAGAHSLYGLDTELAKHLGVERMEVFTGTAEFPFAWFYCDEKAWGGRPFGGRVV